LYGGKKNADANSPGGYDMDSLPIEALVSRYEEVRGQVIRCHGVGASKGQGLALMLHRGLAAWLRAWLNAPPVRPAKLTPVARKVEDENVTAQIVSIIATMALSNEQEIYL
jgi:hypothetical protein